MKITIHKGLILLALLISACGENHQHKNETKKIEANINHSISNELKLSLNEGIKWNANTETTQGVLNMAVLVENFEAGKDINKYHYLKTKLEAEFQMIFKKCTMKGKAHDQLHNFLFPMKNIFTDLGSENILTASNAYMKLKQHLPIYKDYFE